MMKRGVSTTDLCIAATLTTTSKHTATAAVQAQCGEAHQNPIRDSHKPRTINIFHRPPKATWRQWAGEADKASFDDERTQIESLGGGGREGGRERARGKRGKGGSLATAFARGLPNTVEAAHDLPELTP